MFNSIAWMKRSKEVKRLCYCFSGHIEVIKQWVHSHSRSIMPKHMYMEYYNQPFQKLTYSDIKVHDCCKRGSCVSLSNKHLFRQFLLHGRVVKSYALIIIRGFILFTISRFSIRKCFPSSKPKDCQVDLFQLYTVVIIFTYRTISK